MKTKVLSFALCVLMVASVSAQNTDVQPQADSQARVELRKHGPRHSADRRQIQMQSKQRGQAVAHKHAAKKMRKHHEQLTPEQRAQRKADFFNEKLTLTKKQQTKLYAIFLDEAQAFEKNKSLLTSKDENAKKEFVEKQHASTDKQVKKVLTKEEFAKYQQINSPFARPKGGHGGHRGHGGLIANNFIANSRFK